MDAEELRRRADYCRTAAQHLRAHNQPIAAAAVEAQGRAYEAAPEPHRHSLFTRLERLR